MKIYITYFSYDGDEYSLWDLSRNRDVSISTFKNEHVPFLIIGCQPDISVLTLLEVDVSEELYNVLEYLRENKSEGEEVKLILQGLEESDRGVEIYSVDGTIGFELLEYWFSCENDLEDYDELFDDYEYSERLSTLQDEDPEEYKKLVDEFIKFYFE